MSLYMPVSNSLYGGVAAHPRGSQGESEIKQGYDLPTWTLMCMFLFSQLVATLSPIDLCLELLPDRDRDGLPASSTSSCRSCSCGSDWLVWLALSIWTEDSSFSGCSFRLSLSVAGLSPYVTARVMISSKIWWAKSSGDTKLQGRAVDRSVYEKVDHTSLIPRPTNIQSRVNARVLLIMHVFSTC